MTSVTEVIVIGGGQSGLVARPHLAGARHQARRAGGGPPGPPAAWLGETVVHGTDIRRPLGLTRDYPEPALVQVANFFKGSNLLIGARNRIDGLTLRATDTTWATGSGPEVSGPMLSLIMAMTGRQAALADLSGEGVTVLRERE